METKMRLIGDVWMFMSFVLVGALAAIAVYSSGKTLQVWWRAFRDWLDTSRLGDEIKSGFALLIMGLFVALCVYACVERGGCPRYAECD